jgi:NhaP-type Na+/H+ or K+/H+ antiporter
VGMWLAVGAGVGTAIGVATHKIAIGLALGVALGAIVDILIRWLDGREYRCKSLSVRQARLHVRGGVVWGAL